jgi:hypothetical protein
MDRQIHVKTLRRACIRDQIWHIKSEHEGPTNIGSRERAQVLKPFGVSQECGNRDRQSPDIIRTVH